MIWRSVVGWTVTLILVSALYMSVYPAFKNDVDTVREMFNKLPEAMKQAMGIGSMDMFTFLGFLGNVFPFITLIGAIQAMSYGLGMVSKERTAKTTDFLLTKPVTRTKVFVTKFSASMVALILTQVAVYGTLLVLSIFVGAGDFSAKRFWMIVIVLSMIQLWFFSFGLLVASFVKKIRSTTPLALSFVFGFFIVGLLGAVIGEEEVRALTPFKYISYQRVVEHGEYDMLYVLLVVAVFVVGSTVAYLVYKKKDVPAEI